MELVQSAEGTEFLEKTCNRRHKSSVGFVQELLKSLDNAHSLLAKHVETNIKYAETETLLELELDDLRSDCEKYKEELKAEQISLQEKDVELKECRNKMEEKVKMKNLSCGCPRLLLS